MFCDELSIKVIAGSGGDGCSSFRREKFIAKGGPDGGDGGMGGNIIIKTSPHLNTLSQLAAKKSYKAERGGHGLGKKMHGKNGEDLLLEVPIGTIIFNIDKTEQLADLDQIGSEVTIAKGGKGGLGNARFKTSTHQAPKFAENGEPGEEKEITLELKMVADLGLIGMPSAGKSTLISVISNAKPKIAAYHFTTLIPNLGIVDMSKFGGSMKDNFIVADIPGLIEGASHGKGLGYQFLKHISRTKVLAHVIDASLENPSENYKIIQKELKEFDPEMAKKDEIIVINKIDLLNEKSIKKIKNDIAKAAKSKKIFTISALTKEGLKPLLFEILRQIYSVKMTELKKAREEVQNEIPIIEPQLQNIKYKITEITEANEHRIFKIEGERLEQIAIMTDTKNREGLERIYSYMGKIGLQKALIKRNAKLGDQLIINNKHIPYRP